MQNKLKQIQAEEKFKSKFMQKMCKLWVMQKIWQTENIREDAADTIQKRSCSDRSGKENEKHLR